MGTKQLFNGVTHGRSISRKPTVAWTF